MLDKEVFKAKIEGTENNNPFKRLTLLQHMV
jgi:hypothetical protein